MIRIVAASGVIVTDRKVALNDASRPWKVINEFRSEVIGRYATKAEADTRAAAIRKRGKYRT